MTTEIDTEILKRLKNVQAKEGGLRSTSDVAGWVGVSNKQALASLRRLQKDHPIEHYYEKPHSTVGPLYWQYEPWFC